MRSLAAVETRRMLRHPCYGIAFLYLVTFVVLELPNRDRVTFNFLYVVSFLVLLLVYAPMTLVAANRVAVSTYRSNVREVFDVAPTSDRRRTLGVIAGLMSGPGAVGVVGAAMLFWLGEFATPHDVIANESVYQRTPLEYLQIPALILGSGLLGIAVARWLPWPGMLTLVALAVWSGTIAMDFVPPGLTTETPPAHSWLALWPTWFYSASGMVPRQPLDKEMWHLTYLLGLSSVAGLVALLRTDGPRRALRAAAIAAGAVAVVAAWLQLR